jgi:hypothetical protein
MNTQEIYFPIAFTMISSTMITISPALDTAAAVREPEMAEATVNPASTNMIRSRTTIPRGVLIMLIMELLLELPLPKSYTSPNSWRNLLEAQNLFST